MIEIKIEGPQANLIGAVVTKSLRDAGLRVTRWNDVVSARRDMTACRLDARKEDADVLVMAMNRRSR